MIDNINEYKLIFKDLITNGFVYLHPNQNKIERIHNSFVGTFLARLGYKVWLLPPSNLPNVHTADAWLEEEDVVIEFKHCHTPTASAIDKSIQKAKKQASFILLHIDCDIKLQTLFNGIEDRTQRPENTESIEEIWLIYDEKLWKFSRNEIVTKVWRNAFKIE